ncbi:hypothetical protein [Lentzea pudingi]|uniref:hypothetical protein n=1 Tax=Lentzea pudingi TaxID=1789439 RepID=UPI00166B3006|nr:hypothetical protein [Lentzea pudingi]
MALLQLHDRGLCGLHTERPPLCLIRRSRDFVNHRQELPRLDRARLVIAPHEHRHQTQLRRDASYVRTAVELMAKLDDFPVYVNNRQTAPFRGSAHAAMACLVRATPAP